MSDVSRLGNMLMTNTLPCVGFELHYSPLDRSCVENLAQTLHRKSSEFTFDVIQEVPAGQEILMLFSNKQGPTQQLLAVVQVCTKLAEAHFRVTLKTNTNSNILIDNPDLICLPISKGTSTPVEMTLYCPACSNKTPFHFIANQDGDWEHGILPIYNCSSCGTTRALIGLINHNE